ncbi:MAG: hypothetical protein HY821_02995, partial [Acidobacteria bacterium]|nr:hypothetical protein [Acidobacteriota bacterium]
MSLIRLLVIATLLLAPGMQAALIEADWNVLGDKAILQDTSSGLEWLDLNKTAGQSYSFVAANLGLGGLFSGFRYATPAELHGLFVNAGIPDIDVGVGGTLANQATVVNLMTLLNADIWGLHDESG